MPSLGDASTGAPPFCLVLAGYSLVLQIQYVENIKTFFRLPTHHKSAVWLIIEGAK
jgi:hypothetical protein